MAAAALIATFGRFFLRWRYFRALKYDDLFHGIAFISLVMEFALLQCLNWDPHIYNDQVAMDKMQLAMDIFEWTTLYSVKASFLALIWSVFRVSATFRRFWWAITIYTFLAFWITFLSNFWQCGSPSNYADPEACVHNTVWVAQKAYVVDPSWLYAVFHISTDCFILVLPMAYIRRLHIPTPKKIAVAATFAIVIIDIIMGIIKRVSVISALLYGENNDFVYQMNIVCGYVEPALAVIVCALPVYRVLLPSSRRRRSDEDQLRANAAPTRDLKHSVATSNGTTEDRSLLVQEPETAHLI